MMLFGVAQGYLVQFAVIIFLTNTGFAYMGYVLFGDTMREFYTYDQVTRALLQVKLMVFACIFFKA